MSQRYIGQPLRRREDFRLLTGQGRYVDDIQLPNMLHVAFLRSAHGHARITDIATGAAYRLPGVQRVVTGTDWQDAGFERSAQNDAAPLSYPDGRPMDFVPRPVFATLKACNVGDIIAAVVAQSRDAALDGVEAIEVRYEPLPAVSATAKALEEDAAVIHEAFNSNRAVDLRRGNADATQAAFARAHHITELDLISPRISGSPMEPTSYLANHDKALGETTLWAAHQLPHVLRQYLCRLVFNIPESRLRVISPDVGGAFGVKGSFMPEVCIVVWLARELCRPVKWTAARSEAFLTETQARDHVSRGRMAFDAEGRVLALEVDTIAAFGAYVASNAPGLPSNSYPHAITGVYRTPNLQLDIHCVYTNTGVIAPYRGTGRPEATLINERLFENGAREMGIDVVEMRRRNLIRPHEYPYRAPVGRIYDSGNPPALLDKLVALSRYDELRKEQRQRRSRGELLGIGIAAYLDKSGAAPSRDLPKKGGTFSGYESANVRVHSDGKVTILVGTHSHGQGHDITYAAIAADRLGLLIDDIDTVEGDTAKVQFGNGTWGSRSLSVAGSAITIACDQIMSKVQRIAAHLLGCEVTDLLYEDRHFRTAGSNEALSFAELAGIAYAPSRLPKREGFEPGLEALVFYDPVDLNDPITMHLAVVTIDREVGAVSLREYYSVDDCGVVVNPMIVEGQIHGGIVQGIGQAMMEHVIYDSSGQLLTGSFMDYAMPRAADVPPLYLDFHVTPAPGNPLGVKGGAESGTIGPPTAIANAIVDATWHLGVRHVELPLTAQSIWRALCNAASAP